LIDKPRGPTSFDVVAELRRRLGQKRIGHTGTLDPMATGLMVVCAGEACKLVPFLTECDKAYEAEVVFGVRTSTGDAEGEELERRDASWLTEASVQTAARAMLGTIQQRPPMYSAVKVGGKRLHALAREGVEIDRDPRPVEVHALTLQSVAGGAQPCYRMRIHCGKGTYVRVIAEDLAQALGTVAHLSSLRRTRVGRFAVEDATPLPAAGPDTPRLGLAAAITHLPALRLDEPGARRVRAGQERWLFGLADPPVEGRSALLDEAGQLVAVIQRTDKKIEFLRVFVDNPPSPKAHTPDKKKNQEAI
jgi:tRNA pseudouridine55 synthase